MNSGVATEIERTRGEGPGVITQDGCAVEVYRNLPYRGELEVLALHLPPKSAVLDLGCGTGRLSRRLLEKGHSVTAVDNSPDMLRHVPDAANKVCCDIERLALNRTFDVVLFASNLINIGEHEIRRAHMEVCQRHLAPEGALLFQRFDPAWLRTVQPGPFPSIGDVEIVIERAERCGISSICPFGTLWGRPNGSNISPHECSTMTTFAEHYLKQGLVRFRGSMQDGGWRSMPANNTLERTVKHRGRFVLAVDCALADAQQRRWPTAQLSR